MGKLEEFRIEFDHPQAVYHTGDILKGSVILSLRAPMMMRNLRVNIHGRAKVHWQLTSGDSEKHYRAEEVYLDESLILYGSEEKEVYMHPEGLHSYPFEITLDGTLPSSFEGAFGYVRYFCRATIDRLWKFDHDVKMAFTVVRQLDLNKEADTLMVPMEGSEYQEVACCCCIAGLVSAKFSVNRQGFVPGESILVKARVQNDSNTSISGTRVALKQYVEFYGKSDSLFSSGMMKPKTSSSIRSMMERNEIGKNGLEVWDDIPLEIPALPPSRLEGCSIINVSYVVKFYVSINYGVDIKLACDIIIGTVPLLSTYTETSRYPITTQPTIQRVDSYSIPIEPPPPSYEECVGSRVHIGDDQDTEFTRGQLVWAPMYPIYRPPPPPYSPPAEDSDLNECRV